MKNMQSNHLKQITLSPEDLLLDPNNPRLVQKIGVSEKVPDHDFLSRQEGIKAQFAKKGSSESEEFTDISDLFDSMIRIGYVAIDRIVVRHIETLDKYVVIEGNRRVSTIKLIREKAAKGELSDRGEDSERKQYEAVSESFERLEVLELKTKGLTEEEIENSIDIILGLRHFGSVLDWKPLNRSFNAYKNYMSVEPPLERFVFEKKRLKDVATRLSISEGKVKKSLETYVVFKQLSELTPHIRGDHYSLIEAALPLRGYNKYFERNDSTYEFNDVSLEKLMELCQFEKRDTSKSSSVIIPEPKKFGVLGKILKVSVDDYPSAIRDRASALAEAVKRGEILESGDNIGDLIMPVDKAYSLLRSEILRGEWVLTLQKMLDKQEIELPIEKYDGEGNHLMQKLVLEQNIRNLRVIFGL
jgi:hypothetical protein